MLTNLYLRNFTIIEELDLDFLPGMTVLTGETGAGKSIILEAISLVLGSRGDSAFIRHQAERAEICLSVNTTHAPAAKAWLIEQALDREHECIIRRILTRQGKSRAWINGTPVNISQLKQLGETIVDIHGQHEHQQLMQRNKQRILLDEFAGNDKRLAVLKQAYQQWKQLHDRREALEKNLTEVQAKIDLLTFQTQELDELGLEENEYHQLNDEHTRLANAEQLLQTVAKVIYQLYDDEQSLYSLASSLNNDIKYCQTMDESLSPIQSLFDNMLITIQETFSELRTYQDQLNLDPERFQQVEQRIGIIQDLARKHRIKPEQLVEKSHTLHQALSYLTNDQHNPQALTLAINQAAQYYQTQANKISNKRQLAGKRLAKQVTQAMQVLGMKGGLFTIDINTDPALAFASSGIDRIHFMVSANPGQPLQSLAKVASGGELSRISLAIQMITARQLTLPALIFDEVDSGIGGAIAESVGLQLRKLGEHRQILCVTHLAQVAAQSHQHYQVTKIKSDKRTQTGISPLNKQQRIEEIARMMGGSQLTSSTLQLAKEMINQASANNK